MHSASWWTLVWPTLALAVRPQLSLFSSYSFDPLEHLSATAPYFDNTVTQRDPSPPEGCTVKKAAYVIRHGAINSNVYDHKTYIKPFLGKLRNATQEWATIPDLAFLANWTPPNMDEAEIVTQTGKLQATQLGVQLSYRYPNLRLPKRVWTTTAQRTMVTAQAVLRGLKPGHNQVDTIHVSDGDMAGANTLATYNSCPVYSNSQGSKQSREYVNKFTTPIIYRLQSMAPQFNWTALDVISMFLLCGYDTVARGSSPFCSDDLFSPDEWLQFEYSQDLMYYYNVGYGNELSGHLGYPWLNATANVLATPAGSGDQDLYMSFAYRRVPPTILVAMGLFNNSHLTGTNDPAATMPTDQVNYNRAWRSSYISPFLANVGIEKMDCSHTAGYENATDSTYYRVLVNQAPQTIPGCADGPLESCSAVGFQKFIQQRGEMFGDFGAACHVDYENSTNILSLYESPAEV